MIVSVLIPQIGLFPLDYRFCGETILTRGQLVRVPFRNKLCTGIVWETSLTSSEHQLRLFELTDDEHVSIQPTLLELISKASGYYLAPLGTIAKLALPVDPYEPPIKEEPQQNITDIKLANLRLANLSKQQEEALGEIRRSRLPVVLKGVTGSGKTEIYFYSALEALQNGKQVLIMLPEIGLIKQIASRLEKSFGIKPLFWNSSVTKAKKKRILRSVISGTAKIVIGTRSALFLPYKQLGLIVVDEEHDASYKQSDGIAYNARDMAVLRSTIDGNKLILASATPSLESLKNSYDGKYHLVKVQNRYNDQRMPRIELIDMRRESLAKNSWISERLQQEIAINLERGEQTILFLNRRGFAPLLLCKECGYRFECHNCSSSLVYHKKDSHLRCHHCNYRRNLASSCPECKGQELVLSGPGVERLEEEILHLCPQARCKILSREQSLISDEMESILYDVEENNIDILIGTQVITKGYHFPNLTLVGIIDADMGLYGGDFRSSERTFQLLSQVGGRAGRSEKEGRVLLQTYNPENKVNQSLAAGDEQDFINCEFDARRASSLPPFARMASVSFTGKNEQQTKNIAGKLCRTAPASSARLLGPAEALMYKVSGKYRYKILVLAERKFDMQKYLNTWLSNAKIPRAINMKIDIDPLHFV